MRIHWLGTARHFLQVVAFCCVVAVLTTSIWPRHSYWVQLVHALVKRGAINAPSEAR